MGADNRARFRRIRIGAAGGYFNTGDVDMGTGMLSAHAAFSGGRWLVSGYEYIGGDQQTVAPWLWEVGFDAAASERVQDLPALSALSGATLPGQMRSFTAARVRTAIHDIGAAVVAAFPSSTSAEGNSQLNGARPPGVTAPAVAATYRLGCPQ